MMFASLAAALMILTAPAESQSQTDGPVVRLEQGLARGVEHQGVQVWRGLPYAAAPTGEGRWRPPAPAQAWSGLRETYESGSICTQPPSGGDPGVGPGAPSEDCLYLDVFRPIERTAPLPVMVWIHGGGFNNGSGTAHLYDGSSLARRGVMVVSINYRLGRLGFFDHPALAEGRDAAEPAGNYGLMDMIAALRWVQANAAAMGGDPANVTIFGESAGGAAVTRLMISPEARGLFHRAVVQSGLGREVAPRLDAPGPGGVVSSQDRGAAFAREAGLGETAQALRDAPADAFLTPAPSYFGGDLPMVDGRVVDDQVEAAFRAGRQAPVPLIIGTNSKEFWWIKPSDPSAYGAVDDALTQQERAELVQAYGGQAAFDGDVVSDMIFNEPARHLARLHAAAGHPTYLYRFDVVADAMPEPHGGATHAVERPYVFDNLYALGWATTDRDQRAATIMADYWTGFARDGDPNGAGRPAWPDLRIEVDHLLEFTNDGPAAKPIPFRTRLDLIERYFDRTR